MYSWNGRTYSQSNVEVALSTLKSIQLFSFKIEYSRGMMDIVMGRFDISLGWGGRSNLRGRLLGAYII